MNLSSFWHQLRRQYGIWFAAFLVVCFTVIGCSIPAQSANGTQIDPKLKEQVLQILRENPEVIVESVQVYQQRQQEQQAQSVRQAFVEQLKTNPKSIIGDSPTTGAASKNIVLLEFSDFQCPFCARGHKTVQQFMAKHQDKVTLIYKHFPLVNIHPQALPAAKASWAAQQQGKFWEYHDALFEQQKQLGDELYIEIAKKLNLNLDRFNSDRSSKAADNAIKKDVQLAQSFGIEGTPTFIMNGESFSGAVELSEMENVLARVSATKS